MNKYCPDCGTALQNPDRCSCGWKDRDSKEPTKHPNCMVNDCRGQSDVLIETRAGVVARCARHYSEDMRKAGKSQMRGIDEINHDYMLNKTHDERMVVLKSLVKRVLKKAPPPEPQDYD